MSERVVCRVEIPGVERDGQREVGLSATRTADQVEYCLRWCKEGGRVLDPFAGVGTVGVAAQACGIEFVGIELDEGRARIAANRCKP